MGLDMYLEKTTYVGNEYRESVHYKPMVGVTNIEGIKQERITSIVEQVAYWRKANAIHKWFVENVQDGVDDCKRYYVSKEDLQKLLDTVNEVLESSKLVGGKVCNGYKGSKNGMQPIIEDGKVMEDSSVAEELLPVAEGFFFGGKDYDEYYYEDLQYTAKTLKSILAEDGDGDYYYHSSW